MEMKEILDLKLRKVGAADMLIVKSLSRRAAETFLSKRHPNLTQYEVEVVLVDAGKNKVDTGSTPNLGKFRAVAWLCGASFNDLGAWQNVSGQAILNSVRLAMGTDNWKIRADLRKQEVARMSKKTGRPIYRKLSPDQISLLWDRFNELGSEVIEQLEPHVLAETLSRDGLVVNEVEPDDLEPVPSEKLPQVFTAEGVDPEEFMRRVNERLAKLEQSPVINP